MAQQSKSLDLFHNTFVRCILIKTSQEIEHLNTKCNNSPAKLNCTLIHILNEISNELYDSNSIDKLFRFNQHDKYIFEIERHFNKTISNEYFEALMVDNIEAAKAIQSATIENITKDYVIMNSAKIEWVKRWEEARQEQKQHEIEEILNKCEREISNINDEIDSLLLCKENSVLFYNRAKAMIEIEIVKWNQSTNSEFVRLSQELHEKKSNLNKITDEINAMERLLSERAIIIEKHGSKISLTKSICNNENDVNIDLSPEKII